MREKVYSVHNYWDNKILEGVADFMGKPHYLNCIFSNELDDWSDEYYLKPLTEQFFLLDKRSWSYWISWKKQNKIPHPIAYEIKRQKQSFEELIKNADNKQDWERAEAYYQDQIVFNNYLDNNVHSIQAKGIFSGLFKERYTSVEWELIKLM